MKKKRDAGTGMFISDEEAAKKDPNTWIEQTFEDRNQDLEEIYKFIKQRVFLMPSSSELVVPLRDIIEVFQQYGLEIASD